MSQMQGRVGMCQGWPFLEPNRGETVVAVYALLVYGRRALSVAWGHGQ